MTAPKTTRRTPKAPAKPTPEEVIVEESKASVEEDTPETSSASTSQIRVLSGGFLVAGRILTEGSVIEVTEDLGDISEEAQIAAYGKVCFEKI